VIKRSGFSAGAPGAGRRNLAAALASRARVLREGTGRSFRRELARRYPARAPGDIIPADVKLLSGGVSVDQSALTGESQDVDKASGDVLSSGSVVRRGEATRGHPDWGKPTSATTELVQLARRSCISKRWSPGGALAVRHRQLLLGWCRAVTDPRRAADRDDPLCSSC